MIWVWAIFSAVCVGLVMHALARLHRRVLKLQNTYQTRFFSLAGQVVAREDVTQKQLDELAGLSRDMRTRKMQFIVLAALRATDRPKKNARTARHMTDGMSQEMRTLWNRTYFYWLAAVTTQGTIMAIPALTKLLARFDPDQPNNRADSMPYVTHAKPAGVH